MQSLVQGLPLRDVGSVTGASAKITAAKLANRPAGGLADRAPERLPERLADRSRDRPAETPAGAPPTGAVGAVASDDALLVLYANGDPTAAAELMQRLAPRAMGVALRVIGSRAEAEDVTQEAMMRLWRMAPDWQPGQAQVSTWLYRVVMNLCIDLKRRKQGRDVDLDAIADPLDPGLSAADQMQDLARQDALQQALMQLPERQRQAVVLRHLEELTNPEISGIMEISVEAVESLTARGKRALAKCLASRREELGYSDD